MIGLTCSMRYWPPWLQKQIRYRNDGMCTCAIGKKIFIFWQVYIHAGEGGEGIEKGIGKGKGKEKGKKKKSKSKRKRNCRRKRQTKRGKGKGQWQLHSFLW